MILRNLAEVLRNNKFITIQIYDLCDELTNPIDFEKKGDLFESTIGDATYELINLFGDCNIDTIEPILFNHNLCTNIIIKESTVITYDILTNLGYE